MKSIRKVKTQKRIKEISGKMQEQSGSYKGASNKHFDNKLKKYVN